MNFFEHQDQAQRKTKQLLALFAASVLTLIFGIYIATIALIGGAISNNCVALNSDVPTIANRSDLLAWNPAQTSSDAVPQLLAKGGGSSSRSSSSSSRSSSSRSSSSKSSPSKSSPSKSSPSNRARRSAGISGFGASTSSPSIGSTGSSGVYQRGLSSTGEYNDTGNRVRSTYDVRTGKTTYPPCRGRNWFQPGIFLGISVITTTLIVGASWWKILELKAGGSVIAQELGGRLLMGDSIDEAERMLLNVVEEMAIAAGMSVPEVYLLDNETGINAFAAGYTANDAVIGITRGSLDQLTRDELQGVIGHEFSHILNGDMRMNINLMGWLHGILCIYLIGRGVLDLNRYSREKEGFAFGSFGLALMALGGSGLFFGRLMQSAVSRQREFLADASAVQFTRNPDGIASALEKIGGVGSKMQASYAQAASHMFFGSVLSPWWSGDWFATHPPIGRRVMQIRGLQADAFGAQATTTSSSVSGVSGFAGAANLDATTAIQSDKTAILNQTPTGNASMSNPTQVVSQIGTVDPSHYEYAKGLLGQIPPDLRSALREPQSASHVVYALMLDRENPFTEEQQLGYLRQVISADEITQIANFQAQIKILDQRLYLPILDLTVPALRQKTPQDCTRLLTAVHELAKIDGQWTLAEFVTYLILQYRLEPHINGPAPAKVVHQTIGPVWTHSLKLIAALARVGNQTPDQIDYAFRSGLNYLPGAGQQERPATGTLPPCSLLELRQGLEQIRLVTPRLKQGIVDACAHTVMLDNTVTLQEADLLRAIVILLDCPIPPFLEKSGKTISS
jgi:Zn-dependent protease with chaperone function